MANVTVRYHYEGGKPNPGNVNNAQGGYWGNTNPQHVHRSDTEHVVVNVALTPSGDNSSYATESAIRAVLNGAGIGATAYGGKNLVIEGYSNA